MTIYIPTYLGTTEICFQAQHDYHEYYNRSLFPYCQRLQWNNQRRTTWARAYWLLYWGSRGFTPALCEESRLGLAFIKWHSNAHVNWETKNATEKKTAFSSWCRCLSSKWISFICPAFVPHGNEMLSGSKNSKKAWLLYKEPLSSAGQYGKILRSQYLGPILYLLHN